MHHYFGEYEHPGSLIPRLVFERVPVFGTLLDVGGGPGTVGESTWRSKGVKIHVLDAWPQTTTSHPFTHGNVLDALSIFGEKSFDVVMACETIEHIEKEDAKKALEILCKLAKKMVIITMPNGFQHHDPDSPDAAKEPWRHNPYQKHLCGFLYQEMLELGWDVYLNGATATAQDAPQVISMKVIA